MYDILHLSDMAIYASASTQASFPWRCIVHKLSWWGGGTTGQKINCEQQAPLPIKREVEREKSSSRITSYWCFIFLLLLLSKVSLAKYCCVLMGREGIWFIQDPDKTLLSKSANRCGEKMCLPDHDLWYSMSKMTLSHWWLEIETLIASNMGNCNSTLMADLYLRYVLWWGERRMKMYSMYDVEISSIIIFLISFLWTPCLLELCSQLSRFFFFHSW